MDYKEQICSFDNLWEAYKEVSHGKKYNQEFQKFQFNLEENLIELQNELIWGTYTVSPTVSFFIHEPKLRLITRPVIRDRIVHHALIRVVKNEFEKVFNPRSYACREGKGQLAVCNELSHMQRQAINKFGFHFGVVEIDIKSYFATIDHRVLLFFLGEVFHHDNFIMSLFNQIVAAVDQGLPIGFLTSQYEANLIGTVADYMLDALSLKYQLYHIRYMDDYRIYCKDKDTAKIILQEIDDLFSEKLRQRLSPNKTKYHLFQGKDLFCGYNVAPHHLEAKTATVKRAERRLNKKIRDYNSGKISSSMLCISAKNLLAYLSHTTISSNELAETCIQLAEKTS